MTPPFKNYPLIARLFLMFGLFLFNYVLFPGFAVLIVLFFTDIEQIKSIISGNFSSDSDRYIFLFIQAVGSSGLFAFTAILFSQLESGFVSKHLGLNKKTSFRFIALAFFAIVVSQFFILHLS